MCAAIPKGFPTRSSNKELSKTIDDLLLDLMTWGGTSDGENIGPGDARFQSLIDAGQLELQKRLLELNWSTTEKLRKEITSLKEITEEYSNSSKRFADSSKRISIVAISIAILAIVVQIILAQILARSDHEWQKQQLNVLRQIDHNITRP